METVLTKENFDKEVNCDKTVLVDFWATWCGPCMMIAPFVEEIANENPDIKVCKVNVDEEPELTVQYNIEYIPTLIVIKDGKVISSSSGYKSKSEILNLLGK